MIRPRDRSRMSLTRFRDAIRASLASGCLRRPRFPHTPSSIARTAPETHKGISFPTPKEVRWPSMESLPRQLLEKRRSFDRLAVGAYRELRALAASMLNGERVNHTLQPTALVNDAYLRLLVDRRLDPDDPRAFLAAAAGAMRRIVVDHARAKRARKRGRQWQRLPLDDLPAPAPNLEFDVLALHEALTKLAHLNVRQHDVVQLRYFGGLSNLQVASVLGVSERTVENDWRFARVWLYRELNRDPRRVP